MKFQCKFENPKTGERRTVMVSLNDDEIEAAGVSDNPELHAQAYALRRAYAEASEGGTFLHESVEPVPVH